MEDPGDAFRAMAAGRLDGLVSTIDTVVAHLRTGREYQALVGTEARPSP
jgi:hypothetical protein